MKVEIKKVSWVLVLGVLIVPVLNGCNAPKSHLTAFNKQFEAGNIEGSAIYAQERIGKGETPKNEDLLWTLQLAAIERVRKNYAQSSVYFDKSEDMLKYFDEQSRLADGIGATAVNDNILPYRGQEYDGIMVNTYKALNFMSEGKMDLARVEFNRALDRQRRAKENFNQEIAKLRTQLESKEPNEVKANVNNPKVEELLAKKYPNLKNYEVYPDFVNPFTTYMAGVYFKLVGDNSRALDMFKESAGMAGENHYVVEDLKTVEGTFEGNDVNDTVWVIFENGLGPIKDEFRLDLPLFIVTKNVKYVGIALPKLENRGIAYPHLTAAADGNSYNTETIADMDRIVQTEFSKEYGGILTRAIISATTKAAAQYALQSQNSSAGSLASTLAAVYSFATTAADVRIWTTLPKDFQIARFKMPKDRKLKITGGSCIAIDIDIPQCDNAIVYVKITTATAMPVHEIMCF